MNSKISHLDADGRARMVDVSGKTPSVRRAVAVGRVRCSAELRERIGANTLAKGNLLETARLAGIMAAKRTAELIPLCHPLPLDHIDVEASLDESGVLLRATVTVTARTGVEMEALTAVAVAALTVIDMGKSVDKTMVIEHVCLIEKTGGKSGDFKRDPEHQA
jgi:cyclic pyranopterin phosphate synthase